MNKAMDFQALRKKRQKKQFVKRLLALAGIAAVLCGIVFINQYFISIGVTTHISDMLESFGGSGFPVSRPGGTIKSAKPMDGGLAVLNDTNLYLYSTKGKIANNIQQMGTNPFMLAQGGRVLTYSVGGSRVAVHTRSKEIFAKEYPLGVRTATMNRQGYFALVTSSQQFVAEVAVFSPKFEELFRWQSSENMVTHVSLSPSGSMMAVGCLNTQGGMLKSSVHLFQLNASLPVAQIELPDNLLLGLDFAQENRIAAITDKQYLNFSSSGTELSEYVYDEQNLAAYESEGKELLLLLGNYKDTRTQKLVLVDSSGRETATITSHERIKDIAFGSRKVYVLLDEGIRTYDKHLAEVAFFPARNIDRIVLSGGKLFYFTPEEINVLTA